jgi:hypothetical protein
LRLRSPSLQPIQASRAAIFQAGAKRHTVAQIVMAVEKLFEQRVIPAVVRRRPAAGPLPLQQFTGRARNLGDAQAGKIRGDLTDQFEIGGGKLATGKGQ